MQLKEIVNIILEKKFSELPETKRPQALASELHVHEIDIKRAAGMVGGSGRNQEKTFQLTKKLLPICKELGINIEGRSDMVRVNQLIKEVGHATLDTAPSSTNTKREGASKARIPGGVPTSRIVGTKRRRR